MFVLSTSWYHGINTYFLKNKFCFVLILVFSHYFCTCLLIGKVKVVWFQGTRGGQRTTYRDKFSTSSNFVQEIELKSSGLVSSALTH